MIAETSFTATEAEIKQRIEALRGAGYTQFTIQLVPGQEAGDRGLGPHRQGLHVDGLMALPDRERPAHSRCMSERDARGPEEHEHETMMTRPPKLGISFSFQAHRGLGEPYDKAYREGLELAAEASRLGYHSVWASEHHGEADGYCPSPVVACAALAVAAPNCRVGQARGAGAAARPSDAHGRGPVGGRQPLRRPGRDRAWGRAIARPSSTSSAGTTRTRTRAFEESLDILEKAWTGEPFDYAGKIYNVKSGLLRPPPVKPGRPPLWIGAAHPKARARAVRRRAGFLVAPLRGAGALVEYQFKSFDEEAARQRRRPAAARGDARDPGRRFARPMRSSGTSPSSTRSIASNTSPSGSA